MNTKRGALVAVLTFVITISPYARAEAASAAQIGDPVTDTIQIWTAFTALFQTVTHELAIALELHQPPAPAQAASAALVTEQQLTSVGVPNNVPSTGQASEKSSIATTTVEYRYIPQRAITSVVQVSSSSDGYVTQSEFAAGLSALNGSLTQIISRNSFEASASPPLGGGAPNTIAAASAIDQLSGVTITNANLTASEIPDLSGTYLPITGGTVTGNLAVTGAFSGGSLSLLTASTSNFVSTNASSTNFFSTFGSFTTGLINTLSGNTLTYTAASTTNATTTNFVATNATTTNIAVSGASFLGGNLVVTGTSTLAAATITGYPFSIKGNSTETGSNAYDLYISSASDAVDGNGIPQFNTPTLDIGGNRGADAALAGQDGSATLLVERAADTQTGTPPYTFAPNQFAARISASWPLASTSISSTNAEVSSGGSSAGNHAAQNTMIVGGDGFGDTALEVGGYGGMLNALYVNTQADSREPNVFPKAAALIQTFGVTNDSIGLELNHQGVPSNGTLFEINAASSSYQLLNDLFKINGPLNAPGGTLTAGGAYADAYVSGNLGVGISGNPNRLEVIGTGQITGGGVGTAGLYVDSTGNVGIGTTGPGNAALEIVASTTPGVSIANTSSTVIGGAMRITDSSYNSKFALGLCNTSGTCGSDLHIENFNGSLWNDALVIQNASGNIGIGTTSPGSILSVAGSANFVNGATSTIYKGLNVSGGCISLNGNCISLSSLGGILGIANGGTNATSFTSGQLLAYNGTSFVSTSTIGNGELANSTISLSSSGSITVSSSPISLGGAGSLNLNLASANNWTGLQTFANASSTNLSNFGFAYFGGTATTTIDSSGNIVGAGTLSAGTTTITNLAVTNNSTSTFAGGLTVGTSNLVVQQATGNVGIGLTNPSSLLSVGNMNLGAQGSFQGIAIGNNGSNSILKVGQDSTHQVQFVWLYNATAGSAIASLNTYGNSNALRIDASTLQLQSQSGGNVGIGTTTPYSRLEVWGPDTASTSAFVVANNASTTEFTVYDTGNAVLAGGLTQNSDQRLKTNIQSLNASSSLSLIDQLNPVTFNWIDPNKDVTPQLGFIAQQVLPIFPNLVATTSATALTPDGTLSLNYIDLISPIVSAIQALSSEITSIENTITGFATIFHTQELCVGSTCVTPQQFQAMVAAASASQGEGSQGSSSDKSALSGTDTSPVISINGENPAILQVGATYSDLGATITGPQGDLNLGIATFLNGTLTSNIVIDTSAAATDTIDYVATDQNGLTSTSTRTVIVEAPAASNSSSSTASSTNATSSLSI